MARRARRQPWDMLPDEPVLWFERFDKYYRPMPAEGRSLLAAYNAWRQEDGKGNAKKTSTSWTGAARRYHWRERASSWDAELRRLRHAEEQRQVWAMLERHRLIGQTEAALGMRRLEMLGESLDMLSVADARALIRDGVELERSAAGIPEGALDIQKLDDYELINRYRSLLDDVAGTGGHRGGDETPRSGATDATGPEPEDDETP